MQKKEIELIERHMKSSHPKRWASFRFIILICIAFLFPQLAFTTQHNEVGFTNLCSAFSKINHFEKGTSKDQELQLNLFVEAEPEDEDDEHDEHEHVNDFIATYQTFNAFQHSDAINTLYLRLASDHQHKADLPFFILYHSWKSHLA